MPLTASSPASYHLAQNLFLLTLAFLSFPFSTTFLFAAYAARLILHGFRTLGQIRSDAIGLLQRQLLLPLWQQLLALRRRVKPGAVHDADKKRLRSVEERRGYSKGDAGRGREVVVLVTGLSMNKGLTLARMFKKASASAAAAQARKTDGGRGMDAGRVRYKVVGADTDQWAMGRVSAAVDTWYTLPAPAQPAPQDTAEVAVRESKDDAGLDAYTSTLLQIIQREGVDLWVSCSGVSTETLDGRARDIIVSRRTPAGGRRCGCVQLGRALTEELHEKDRFMDLCKRIGLGAAVPETRRVVRRGEVHGFLHQAMALEGEVKNGDEGEKLAVRKRRKEDEGQKNLATNDASGPAVPDRHPHHHHHPALKSPKKHYILKPTDVDDASRSDMTLLPRRTPSLTYDHISKLQISAQRPYILQQFVRGREYCTHALVVKGRVKAFVAAPSSELLMHYTALSNGDMLSRAMLGFTRGVAGRLQAEADGTASGDVTGHLSFDFLVEESVDEESGRVTKSIKCIECNPRVHTAVALFRGREAELADAYLSVLDDHDNDYNDNNSAAVADRKQNLTSSNENDARHLNGTASPSGEKGVALRSTKATMTADRDADDPTEDEGEDTHPNIVTPLPTVRSVYWLPHDIVTLLIFPLYNTITSSIQPPSSNTPTPTSPGSDTTATPTLASSMIEFLTHVLTWQEGMFSIEDPLPWWWNAQVFWPVKFAGFARELMGGGLLRRSGRLRGSGDGEKAANRGMWSRVNVSTGKVFGC